MEMEINVLQRHRWESLADQANAVLQQRWDYGEAAKMHGRSVARIVFRRSSDIFGIAQVIHRPVFGLGPSVCLGGPIWVSHVDPDLKMQATSCLLKEHPFRGPLIIMPPDETSKACEGGHRLTTPVTLALLPLMKNKDDMRRAMKGKWRNRLAFAEASGLSVTQERPNPDKINALLLKEHLQRSKARYKGIPLPFIKSLATVTPSKMRLLTAYDERAECAQMLHLQHGNSATYLIGWSDQTGRDHCAHNLLMWQAMGKLASVGVHQLDLGSINTLSAPGLARFKLGTGAIPHRTGGAWAKLIPRVQFNRKRASHKVASNNAF